MQAKDAICLAMKETTPEGQTGTTPEKEKEAAEKVRRRYGQRERTQVVLYSPGREGAQPPSSAATSKVASPKEAKEVRKLLWGLGSGKLMGYRCVVPWVGVVVLNISPEPYR